MEIIRRHRGERNVESLIPMFVLDRDVYLVVAKTRRIEKKATRVFFIVSSLQTPLGSGGDGPFPLVEYQPLRRPSRLAELDRFCDALISIREEIAQIENGKANVHNNVLKVNWGS
ncbi:hypothetical protein Taro_034519 [Colocasia esculenta]|uniref:Glycine dehydrogenase C-terminal domain-containing protein n=1 Tax=Colocasia esculenta TaxID=4460 RepID=A0A843WFQ6_COLES|nr:hypothetical protein [Colocasia esculenta]